jgi:hydrogenase expression/formation protein HypE
LLNLTCPLPWNDSDVITMAHGGGGRRSRELVDRLFRPAFRNSWLDRQHDAADLPPSAGRLAFTSDSYIVQPLFFPGGDIGKLAVFGTLNDLAMCGAQPLYLSANFILEEGCPLNTLRRVVESMAEAARAADVAIVTGDTKVIERSRGDHLYLSMSGVGKIDHPQTIAPASIQPGDAILLSGDIGRHGIAVMAEREGLRFETRLESDCASLVEPALALLAAGIEVHCFRDLTRGGLGAALVEIAETSGQSLQFHEEAVPVCSEVAGACELLGFDPLYVACEGRFIVLLPERDVERAIAILSHHSLSPCRIGSVQGAAEGRVTMRTRLGVHRLIDLPSGEQLPRIC